MARVYGIVGLSVNGYAGAMKLAHPDPLSGASYSAVELMPGDAVVTMLDQRRLPTSEEYVELRDASEVAAAIRDMVVRGAPAIGIAAAYGLVVEAHRATSEVSDSFTIRMRRAADLLISARPTAVNLAWAVSCLMSCLDDIASRRGPERVAILAEAARTLHRDDVAACRAMGARGASMIPDGATVLTHCNAGALATGGYGTALGVIRAAVDAGKRVRVLADETRPYLQGARLTAWELARDGIPVEIITDGMCGHFFSRGAIDVVVVGADRVALNGDVANKIGTYGVACLAHLHERPFVVAAPTSTLDPQTRDGQAIHIEERTSDEVLRVGDVRIAPDGVLARHPAFDITPARLVTRLVTERGMVPGIRAGELMPLPKTSVSA
jgi:methylthioribose-1-phosphate isomerase